MLFKLTIPRDVLLAPAVRQIAERVAQCAGYTAADAVCLASSVGLAVDTVLARQAPDASSENDPLEIRFEREDLHLDVWLRYRAGEQDRPVVDAGLSSEALRQGMESVEFGREGEVAYCRMRRALPAEKVDHRCEVPPEGR